MTDKRYNEVKLKRIDGLLDMSGDYNLSDNGYDFCLRGMVFFFALTPGKPFQATAELLGGFTDPEFHLRVRREGGDNKPRMLKEEVPTEPASKFKSHGHCTGAFLEGGPPVPVTVHITANAKGGVEVQLVKN